MAVPAAKRRANDKWDAENMATLSCKVKRDQAERFKAYCENKGQKANAALRDYVLSCIDEKDTQE